MNSEKDFFCLRQCEADYSLRPVFVQPTKKKCFLHFLILVKTTEE